MHYVAHIGHSKLEKYLYVCLKYVYTIIELLPIYTVSIE